MQNILKYISSKLWKPLLSGYLQKPRKYSYQGITLTILPGVFHPGFFFSTKFLLNYLSKINLESKNFLELGAGSGLISFVEHKRGAIVTASDISSIVIQGLKKNTIPNNLPIQIIQSDLFQNIPSQIFDILVINPPYYKKNPKTENDYAWYCGENLEYFSKLFISLKNYIHEKSRIIMILSDDCDIQGIKKIASQNHFQLKEVERKKIFWEQNIIFEISPE